MSRIVSARDAEWPRRLGELGPYPPPGRLFVEGSPLPVDDALVVAVVGTRRPTSTGLRVAQELATDLCAAGVVVVSGLAVGIDAAAHRAALEASGHTVAVLGCGLDVDDQVLTLFRVEHVYDQNGNEVVSSPLDVFLLRSQIARIEHIDVSAGPPPSIGPYADVVRLEENHVKKPRASDKKAVDLRDASSKKATKPQRSKNRSA